MIILKNISFSYGQNNIFTDFSLTVKNGERICITGNSGLGKTTLLRLIMGLENPNVGTVDTENAKISAVFQEDRLLPFKTVAENLLLFADYEKVKEGLSMLGISETEKLYPSELSGGMARRVSIARALARKADIYILDEPFSGLDTLNKQKAADFINFKTKGKILVAVSHSSEDAEMLNAKTVDLGTF